MLVLKEEVANLFFGAKKAIVGYSGESSTIGSVFSWLSEPIGRAPGVRDVELIVLTSNKEIYTNYNFGGWIFVDKPYYSIGSGSHFALGVLASGKGSSKAVEVASSLDPSTGQGITEIRM